MREKTSVCMATYNGSKYIKLQLSSILNQLSENDEIIIVDDCSQDNTVEVIQSLYDDRIKIYLNNINLGHVKTFEKAIGYATGEFIFLSDQDDIWCKNRVENMLLEIKNTNSLILASSFDEIDENNSLINDKDYMLFKHDSKSKYTNLCKIFLGTGQYWGCTMCFHKSLKKIALPIPSNVISHDIWLAMIGIILNKIVHFESKTLQHRIHLLNATPKKRRSFYKIILTRFLYIFQILIILKRLI